MIILINNKKTNRLSLIEGEKKNIQFTVKDNQGTVVDISSATLSLMVKLTKDTSALITVADGSFTKTDAANGIVLAPIDTTALTYGNEYFMELKITYSANSIDYSGDIKLTITQPTVA
jgi:hypothetical protein